MMIYREFKDKKISYLGFGLMRLPQNEDKSIDKEETARMVDYAMKNGVNYFDTAYPYHGEMSEVVIGEILQNYPRESYYLADKYPGHQPVAKYDPAGTFEEQLRKCRTEYFDFYLLHNISAFSIDVYLDETIGIVKYFVEQKKQGRIKHLGFSTHADIKTLTRFLDAVGEDMEFCQIQMNYLDWKLQDAKAKYELLTERNIPIIVMEPLRGGGLSNVEQSFRWIMQYPGIFTILSGMSNLDQMKENVEIFTSDRGVSEEEKDELQKIADGMVDYVPCTSCYYCAGCPLGLDIPAFMALTSDARKGGSFTITMALEALPEEKLPSACIGCGACVEKCPQGINIPEILKELTERWEKMPKWRDVCIAREKEAEALKKKLAEEK